MVKDHWSTTERGEKERETLTSLRLGCLSHSHLHKDHVRRQSVTYLPFQSVTRMQYQQKKGKKEKKEQKRRKECSPQRNGKKTMTSFSITATYLVQRLRTRKTNQKSKENRGKENPDGVQKQTKNQKQRMKLETT